MNPSQWIPLRWPAEWRDPAALEKLRGTPVNCLVMQGPLVERAVAAGFAVVDLAKLPASILCLNDAVWPGIRASGADKGDAPAGPTGVPWADSNGWLIRRSKVLAPGKTIWVVFDPPKDSVIPAESYVLAAADAEAYGGRWVISPGALGSLQPVARALAFFERHKEWREYQAAAALGVVSDFAGPNEFASGEALNLLARRHQPCRIVEKSRVSQTLLAGLKAVLYVDQDPPGTQVRDMLLAFTQKGGLLIVPRNWKPPNGMQVTGEAHPRYHVGKLGGGRMAIAKEEVSDPYVLAADSQILMSHRNDLVRIWNGGSTNSYYLRSPDGRKAVIEMINYATRPGDEPISLRVMGRYQRARFLTVDGETPLKVIAAGGGTEFHLPRFSVYGAVELEK